ncbi:MAG: hypothetical protein JSW05_03565 [Candidatus Thorarchaeota archaeon]|nr:MAG: hypothetical protein JSW05_03565 [Candidatus Thorarchaeota archaeon]
MTSGNLSLVDLELKTLKEMRKIAWNLESASQESMYQAAQGLSLYDVNRTLLPKAMTLLRAEDTFLQKLVVRTVGRNVYGGYIGEFFDALRGVSPAELAQVLMSIREAFKENGSPVSLSEQKRWIGALEGLGREHQPGILELMATLGTTGFRWTKRIIKEDIENLNIGALASIREFQEKHRNALVSLLCEEAAKRKRDLLPYIAGVVDSKNVRFLSVFLGGKWKERKEVARGIGRVGIYTTSGIVRQVLNDPDWRVKQALIESIDVRRSRFTSLLRILEIMVADSHKRVHGSARRLLLRLGTEACTNSDVATQREKLVKRFRDQLLKAAPSNKDIDSSWLGLEVAEDGLIPFISPEDSQDKAHPEPIGISDFAPPETDLRKALLKKMLETKESTVPPMRIDDTKTAAKRSPKPRKARSKLAAPARFLSLMDSLSANLGTELPLAVMRVKAPEIEMSEKEFDKVLDQLVKEGTVYMVDNETVSRVDIQPDS